MLSNMPLLIRVANLRSPTKSAVSLIAVVPTFVAILSKPFADFSAASPDFLIFTSMSVLPLPTSFKVALRFFNSEVNSLTFPAPVFSDFRDLTRLSKPFVSTFEDTFSLIASIFCSLIINLRSGYLLKSLNPSCGLMQLPFRLYLSYSPYPLLHR